MRILPALILIMLQPTTGLALQRPKDDRLEFFESRVRPTLIKHCYACHSVAADKSRGGLLLDSRDGWAVGGDSGPAIVPFEPDESILLHAVSHNGVMSEMPPTSRLPDTTISDIRKWIADGAIDPRNSTRAPDKPKQIDLEAGRRFWAFQPRRQFNVDDTIDAFLPHRSPAATPSRLVRRLYLDLIGLPPTLEEQRAFLKDYKVQPQAAVATVVDALLARPQFGEKWARHWLDVSRYADSNGGDFNLTFHEAWRYRNYVIDAFNSDMPYDQFVTEQIAGDLLPATTSADRNRQLIATGFLMIGPKMLTERNKPKMHLDIADEQLDTVGRAIMGMTLGCARCHDHKFDPIPTSDYYAMAGIFHSTRTADGILMNNVNVSGWKETELEPDDKTRTQLRKHERLIAKRQRELDDLKTSMAALPAIKTTVVDDTQADQTGPWRKSTYRPNHIGNHYLATSEKNGPCTVTWKATLPKPGEYELRASFCGGSGITTRAKYVVQHAEGSTVLVVDQTKAPSIRNVWTALGRFRFEDIGQGALATVTLTDEDADGPVIADAIQFIHTNDILDEADDHRGPLVERLTELESELNALTSAKTKPQMAMAAADHSKDRPGDLQIRIRGEVENHGAVVPRGFLRVATDADYPSPNIPDHESGRRQFAEWITNPNHPLTARVISNRIWQQMFGRGLVTSSDNFGMRGSEPSHPQLLDHLAGRLLDDGWSMKSLIRRIACSRAYQQQARTAAPTDPDNREVRHQNRRPASAESIRDSILFVAGKLDTRRHESAVKQLGMYAIATSGVRHKSLTTTEKLRQRSIYLPFVRGAEPPSLSVFDLPNPDLVTGRRTTTTVPSQALFMLNSEFIISMARAVSQRVDREDESTDEIIRKLYKSILIRNATPAELDDARSYIEDVTGSTNRNRQQAFASLVQILFCSTEFRFIE